MRKWYVWPAYVPDGEIRLRYGKVYKIPEPRKLISKDEKVLWTGRPHLTYLRWGVLLAGTVGLSILAFIFLVVGDDVPLRESWPFVAMGLLILLLSVTSAMAIARTDYYITDKQIIVARHAIHVIDQYQVGSFSKRLDVFGYMGTSREPSGLYDVFFLKCADGSMGKSASNWKTFDSVSASDREKLVVILKGLPFGATTCH